MTAGARFEIVIDGKPRSLSQLQGRRAVRRYGSRLYFRASHRHELGHRGDRPKQANRDDAGKCDGYDSHLQPHPPLSIGEGVSHIFLPRGCDAGH
jgi:hypothetical protein